MNKSLNIKKQSAALIIALIIVAVVGLVVVAVGRDIVQSSFSASRYPNSLIANQLAWAGVEDGLSRLKQAGNSSFSVYLPNFPAANYDYVIRRNLSEFSASSNEDEIAGIVGPANNILGIDYHTELGNSCSNQFNNCTSSRWDSSDKYYDLRASASDDDISSVDILKRVNVSGIQTVLRSSKYYEIPSSATPIYKFFDLSKYTGNTISNLTIPASDPRVNFGQRIGIVYDIGSVLPTGSSIYIDAYVKYGQSTQMYNWIPDPFNIPETAANTHLQCFDIANPGRYTSFTSSDRYATGNYFYNRLVINSSLPSNGTIATYIPNPCDGANIAGTVSALVLKFTFNSVSPSTRLYLGLKTLSGTYPPSGAPLFDYAPLPSSYLGTGLNKIISTGIASGTRKTIEISAVKSLSFLDIAINDPNNVNQITCSNGNIDLNLCHITIYRDF